MPRVSIGLPVYNGEKLIEETLDSLLSQTFEDFELVISDNASTDKTQEICESFGSKDRRIRYYRSEENHGAAWNYNHVFELSKGELFKWASHDDLCAPTYVERCVEVLEREPSIVLCYPRTVIINEKGTLIGRYYDRLHLTSPDPYERLKKYFLSAEGKECNAVFGVIRSSSLAKTPLIGNYIASDQVLLAYLMLLGRFYEIPEELFFRRDHPGTSLRANPDMKDIAVWFDPANKGKIVLLHSHKVYEYIKCVISANLSMRTRMKCFMPLGKWMWWRKAFLAKEIRLSIRQSFFSSSSRKETSRRL